MPPVDDGVERAIEPLLQGPGHGHWRAEYIAGFTGTPAPDEAKRTRGILMKDVTGDTAIVKAALRIDGEWKIVHKIFHREPRNVSQPREACRRTTVTRCLVRFVLRVVFATVATSPLMWCSGVSAASQPARSGEAARIIVRDAATGAPLPGARVQCAGMAVAATDRDGQVTLHGCGSDAEISADGYVTARVALAVLAGAVNVPLVPVRRTQESVTVTGATPGDLEAAVPSQIAISRDELAMLRSATFDDPLRALQALPGVATSDELRAELSVRGSPFRHVGLVLDEVKSRLLVHTVRGVEQTGSVALLNADLLASATLTPGAGPQRFGNTLGAELSLRTRPGRSDGLHGRVLASAIASTASVEGPIGPGDRVTLIAGARRSYASWIVRRVDPDVSGTFEFIDTQARIDARLTSRQQLSAGVLGGSSVYDERGRRRGANALDTGRNRTIMATVAWQAQVGSRWLVRQRLARVTSTYRNENPDGGPLDVGTEQEALSRTLVEWAPHRSVSIDGSLMAERFRSIGDSTLYDITTRAPQPVRSHAGRQTWAGGHVHARWAPHRAVTVASGMRADHVPEVGTFAGPWLQAQVALSPALVVTTALARHGQAPDVLQRFGPNGARSLTFERATLGDIGLGWRRGAWALAAAAYVRREHDVLDTPDRPFRITPGVTLAGGNPRAPWQNALSGRARGVELVLRRQPSARSANAPYLAWTGWIGYSYATHTLRPTGGDVFAAPFDQRHLLTMTSSASLAQDWDVSGTARLATNWPYDGYFESRGNREFLSVSRNALRLPRYARVDVRVRRTVALPAGKLLLFAEVINALNARNLRQVSSGVDTRTFEITRLSERQLPILPTVGVAWEW